MMQTYGYKWIPFRRQTANIEQEKTGGWRTAAVVHGHAFVTLHLRTARPPITGSTALGAFISSRCVTYSTGLDCSG